MAEDRRLLRAIELCALFAAVVLSLSPIVNADFWLNEATGRWIVEHGAVVRTDPFSFTAGDRPWIEHKWLFDVAVHLLLSWFGPAGPIGLKVVAVAVVVGAAVHPRRGALSVAAAAGFTLLVVVALPDRFTVRAHVLGYAALAVTHALLRAEPEVSWRRLAPALLGVQVLWANVHGSFLLGPALVVLHALGAAVEGRGGHLRRLGLTVGLLAASCLNPYGPRLLLAPFQHALLGAQGAQNLAEWQPVTWAHVNVALAALALTVVVGAVLGARSLRRERRGVADLLVLLAMALLAARAYRFVAPFFIVAAPLTVRWWLDWRPLRGTPARARRVAGVLAALMALAPLPRAAGLAGVSPLRLEAPGMPVAAVDWLQARGVAGDAFNSFNYGGYLAARLAPAVRIVIDGRLDLYDPATFADYYQVMRDPAAWAAWPHRDRASVVLMRYADRDPTAARFMARLLDGGGWATVFIGPEAAVLLRRGAPGLDPIIAEHELRLLRPTMDLGPLVVAAARDPALRARADAEASRCLAAQAADAPPPLALLVRGELSQLDPDPAVRAAGCAHFERALAALGSHPGVRRRLVACRGT